MKKIKFMLLCCIFTFLTSGCSTNEKQESILMQVHAIQGDPHTGPVLVYLTNENKGLFLSMIINGDQALSIYYARNDIQPKRPLTHDLFSKLIDTLNYHIDHINITSMKKDTYYSEIHLVGGKNNLVLDARPSDAIALALRQGAPIYSQVDILRPIETNSIQIAGEQQLTIPQLGLTVQNLNSKMQKFFGGAKGIIVSDLEPDSRAANSGLKPGDIIIALNGYPAVNISEIKAIIEVEALKSVQIDLIRNGKKNRIEID
ncbi:MAG: PDZ domain-containing protein [Calditrichaeota bacterium]|nr:MAG: PDZ domain-containing protein [Calditrichota bacterium]